MSIPLNVGQFTSSTFSVLNADGGANTALSLNVQSGNDNTLRVRVNPSNNREVGVLALDVSVGVNATVSVTLPGGAKQSATTFVNSPAAVNQEALTPGPWSSPAAPPAWML